MVTLPPLELRCGYAPGFDFSKFACVTWCV